MEKYYNEVDYIGMLTQNQFQVIETEQIVEKEVVDYVFCL